MAVGNIDDIVFPILCRKILIPWQLIIVEYFVQGILEGYNCTVFAYGQTGCGKSFSMQGVDSPSSQRGIIPRAFEHVFEAISVTDDVKFLVLASYIEIYNEEVRDLLSSDTKRRLELKESPERGVYVHGTVVWLN